MLLIDLIVIMERVLKEDELEDIYNWVDEIPLSRPKRNMARDFSDAGKDDLTQSSWQKSSAISTLKQSNYIITSPLVQSTKRLTTGRSSTVSLLRPR